MRAGDVNSVVLRYGHAEPIWSWMPEDIWEQDQRDTYPVCGDTSCATDGCAGRVGWWLEASDWNPDVDADVWHRCFELPDDTIVCEACAETMVVALGGEFQS